MAVISLLFLFLRFFLKNTFTLFDFSFVYDLFVINDNCSHRVHRVIVVTLDYNITVNLHLN